MVTADYQGEADMMKVFFYSDNDTTLVVQTPDGDYLCNDDGPAACCWTLPWQSPSR